MADNDNDNAWDDTELIKMYEKSTSQAYVIRNKKETININF
jgi:hypothetical protein